jgi:NAD(P)-dependent dehydrogenase (short-subunit alcohol dehydrogenase family)
VTAHPVDVTDAAAMQAAVDAIEAAEGPLDVAILNAGLHQPVEPRKAFAAQVFRRLLDVNVMGVVHGIEAVLPRFLARRHGRIVIVASVAGYRGLPTAAAYGATKAALINLAEALKLDLDGSGVEVQLICPGFVATPATDRNPFPMPFLMPAEAAAARVRKALASRRFEVTFPRRFTWQLKLLSMLPYGAYFWIVHRFTGR